MPTPVLADWQVNIGGAAGVTMGKGTQYLIMDFGFFGTPDLRTTDTPRGNASGDMTGRDYYGSRAGSFKVTIAGNTASAAMDLYNALVDQWWLRPTETSRPLQFKLPGQVQKQMIGKPRRLKPDMSRLLAGIISIELEYYAPDLSIFAADLTSLDFVKPSYPGRTYPRTYPLTYPAGPPPPTVTNDGNLTVAPTVTVYGPCTNPVVQNVTQGRWVKVAITLSASDYLEIDMDAHSILLNGTASRRALMTPDSTWWDLDVGSSEVRFLADSAGTGAKATIAFYSAWLG